MGTVWGLSLPHELYLTVQCTSLMLTGSFCYSCPKIKIWITFTAMISCSTFIRISVILGSGNIYSLHLPILFSCFDIMQFGFEKLDVYLFYLELCYIYLLYSFQLQSNKVFVFRKLFDFRIEMEFKWNFLWSHCMFQIYYCELSKDSVLQL